MVKGRQPTRALSSFTRVKKPDSILLRMSSVISTCVIGGVVGLRVGAFVGAGVGVLVGIFAGAFVGTLVGTLAGAFVGAFVGTKVGGGGVTLAASMTSVGTSVGTKVMVGKASCVFSFSLSGKAVVTVSYVGVFLFKSTLMSLFVQAAQHSNIKVNRIKVIFFVMIPPF